MTDAEEFTVSLNSCRSLLLNIAFKRVSRPDEAEDVVQKASIILWEKYNTFDRSTCFTNWAAKVVDYVSRNALRAILRRPIVQNNEVYEVKISTLAAPSDDANVAEKAENVLKNLSAADRELLWNVYIEGESLDDVAVRNGKAKRTLYNRLYVLKKNIKL